MARRKGAAPADLRALLAEKEREQFGRWQEMFSPGTPFRPTHRILALEAGDPADFHGHELCLLVPGLNVYGRYRLNRDDTIDQIDDPGSNRNFPRAVRPGDTPATPARKDPA